MSQRRSFVDFECSIDDMAAFLKSDDKRKSQFVFFNHLVCSIEISKVTKEQNMLSEGTDYLSVFVRVDNFAANPASLSTNCKVRLLNRRSAEQDCSFDSYKSKCSDNCLCAGVVRNLSQ